MTNTISYAFCPKYLLAQRIAGGSLRSTSPMFDPKYHGANEPLIIDVTDYEEIELAIDDGKLDRIIDEHTLHRRDRPRDPGALKRTPEHRQFQVIERTGDKVRRRCGHHKTEY